MPSPSLRRIHRTDDNNQSYQENKTKTEETHTGADLSKALILASWATYYVQQGQSLTAVLAHLNLHIQAANLKGACQDLAYQTQRYQAVVNQLISQLIKKPMDSIDPAMLCLLRVSLTLMLDVNKINNFIKNNINNTNNINNINDNTPAYPSHTVVNQAVMAVPALLALRFGRATSIESSYKNNQLNQYLNTPPNPNTKVIAGFINGVLRTYLREDIQRLDAILNQTNVNQALEAQYNHPLWWIKRLQKDYPNEWAFLLHNNNRPPVMSLRANARIHTAQEAQAHLKQYNIVAQCVEGLPNALILEKPLPVEKIPKFQEGWYSVQDLAAQYCVELLDLSDGLKVLDACAAPGGKTAHIVERANVQLTSLDIDSVRLNKIQETLKRLSSTFEVNKNKNNNNNNNNEIIFKQPLQPLIQLKTANAAHLNTWWDGTLFDRIVLDAPCSASGVVRRHPDSRWLRRETDIAQLMKEQADLLKSLWYCLKPQGLMLYITCSVFKSEGEEQIHSFLSKHANATLLPSIGHCLPLSHNNHELNTMSFPNSEHDGFFYALIQKNSL